VVPSKDSERGGKNIDGKRFKIEQAFILAACEGARCAGAINEGWGLTQCEARISRHTHTNLASRGTVFRKRLEAQVAIITDVPPKTSITSCCGTADDALPAVRAFEPSVRYDK